VSARISVCNGVLVLLQPALLWQVVAIQAEASPKESSRMQPFQVFFSFQSKCVPSRNLVAFGFGASFNFNEKKGNEKTSDNQCIQEEAFGADNVCAFCFVLFCVLFS